MKKRKTRLEYMPLLYPNAAGLDIGASEIFACVRADRTEDNVKSFGTFTPDLKRLADWLEEHEVESVAMESTGVYWIPAYDLLEARGFKVFLVNAQSIKGVPGRKSDVQDCQWIQKGHSLGLLTNSFRPDAEMCGLPAPSR